MYASNPIELTAQDQSFDLPCRILAIIWEGTTTAGDTVELRFQGVKTGKLWRGRAVTTQTYLDPSFAPTGIHAPSGFKVQQISAGTVLVYLSEE